MQDDKKTPERESRGEYQKKLRKRRFRAFPEYRTCAIGMGASFGLFLVIFFLGCNVITHHYNRTLIYASLFYLSAAVLQLIQFMIIKKQILRDQAISTPVRLSGLILICYLMTGNFFAAINGFTLIKKEKSLEYTLSFYMLLVSASVMLVSMLNIFKEELPENFYLGMGLLVVSGLFFIFTIFMTGKHIKGRQVDKVMLPIGGILILLSMTGNLFSLALGLCIISKYRHRRDESSVSWIDIVNRLFRNNMSVIGAFIVTFLLSLSIYSFLTFDYSSAVENNYLALLLKPSIMYPFGTDDYGRCVFTRIVFGARISLIIGSVSTVIPMVIGGSIGAIAGYYGNKLDNVFMRIMDVLSAIPSILMAIAIVAAFGASTVNLIIAISLSSIASYSRIVRATVLGLSNAEFVEAARACGAREGVIIFKHIIPNSFAPIIVKSTMEIGTAVLATSSLSFLGLGVEPHIPEWGNILKVGSTFLETNPYLAIFPGLAIIIIVLAFNFFGDGLRDAIDPKLK